MDNIKVELNIASDWEYIKVAPISEKKGNV